MLRFSQWWKLIKSLCLTFMLLCVVFGICSELKDIIETNLDKHGLDVVDPSWYHGGFARPRTFEIMSALNRLRSLKVKMQG